MSANAPKVKRVDVWNRMHDILTMYKGVEDVLILKQLMGIILNDKLIEKIITGDVKLEVCEWNSYQAILENIEHDELLLLKIVRYRIAHSFQEYATPEMLDKVIELTNAAMPLVAETAVSVLAVYQEEAHKHGHDTSELAMIQSIVNNKLATFPENKFVMTYDMEKIGITSEADLTKAKLIEFFDYISKIPAMKNLRLCIAHMF